MTAALAMRDLAYRLLRYEAESGGTSGATESSTIRVYEKLRRSIVEFVGAAGFQSLALRALMLAKLEAPDLATVRIAADGALQGWNETGTLTERNKDQTEEVGEAGTQLIAGLFGLLCMFLGEALTISLLRSAWQGEVFDEGNVVNGRKS